MSLNTSKFQPEYMENNTAYSFEYSNKQDEDKRISYAYSPACIRVNVREILSYISCSLLSPR